MAVDTRNKRAGAIIAGIPWMVIAPVADGSIGAADRQQIVNVYPGILAGEPVVVVDVSKVLIGMTIVEMLTIMELMPY